MNTSPHYNTIKLMSYQQLKQENKKLKELRISCEQELQKLREVGRAHQNQIDTLLKFNERLLGIIENQFNSAAKGRLSSELLPITEANQTVPELASGQKLKTKLPPPPPRIGGGVAFQQQDLDVFLDDDQEEIYNQQNKPLPQFQKVQSAPPASKPQPPTPSYYKPEPQPVPQPEKNQFQKKPEPLKLDKVYEMQHNKEQQISINLSNSIKNSNPTQNSRHQKVQTSHNHDASHFEGEVAQLKELIKEYKQEFVDNSSQYEQICQIIHNDLLCDLQQFKKIADDTRNSCQQQFNSIENLKNQIKWFKPTNELIRVMKKLNVPSGTERILFQRIISRAH